MKKCFGFTLAEVLITLGIIGVVAAITIPNLIQNNYEKRTVSLLRQTQSILAQTVRMAEEEYGSVDGWGLDPVVETETGAIIIADKLKPFMKVALDCGTIDSDGKCFPKSVYSGLDKTVWQSYHNARSYYKLKLNNGVGVAFRASAHSANDEHLISFFVDVNGPLLPNVVGKDLFNFHYDKGSIRPVGAPGYWHEGTCNLDQSGWGCAYVVLQNQNMNYLHKK